MMESLGMILMVVIYLLAAFAEGKKKKAKKQARRRAEKTAFETLRSASEQIHARSRKDTQKGETAVQTHMCESAPIHLHDVPQSVMMHAGEGEDPCHAGGAAIEPDAGLEDLGFDDDSRQSEAMQDILRGVIMSEILTRPCDRRAVQRNRRSI